MNVFRSIKGSLCLLENSSLTIKKVQDLSIKISLTLNNLVRYRPSVRIHLQSNLVHFGNLTKTVKIDHSSKHVSVTINTFLTVKVRVSSISVTHVGDGLFCWRQL